MIDLNIVYMYDGVDKSTVYSEKKIPSWVESALSITRHYNKNAEVYFLNNIGYEKDEYRCEKLSSNYSDDLLEFSSQYEHMSTNHVHMERFCFERWFILRNFMRKNNIPRLLFLDMDVICVDDLCSDFNELKSYSATLSMGSSPHTNYIEIELLESFCSFIYNIYKNKNCTLWRNMKNIFSNMSYGGICDMTLWKWFSKDKPLVLSNLQDFDNSYDHTVRDCKDWSRVKYENMEIKDLVVSDGRVQCFNESLGQNKKMKTVHFQSGPAKHLLEKIKLEFLIRGSGSILSVVGGL